MRRSRLAVFARAVFVGLCACAAVNAQGPSPARAPERLVVQVEYFKGAPLSYETVPGGSWFGRFGLTPAASARAAEETVRAVDVKTRPDGARVEIKVGVYVGARHFDRLDEVGTYYASAGETVDATDLERFGVKPFRMTVLRVSDAAVAPPTIVNRTQSIEAVVSEFETSPMPRVTVTLRNLSSKRILAAELNEVFDGKELINTYLAGQEGKALMGPGGTSQKSMVAITGRPTQTDWMPETAESVVVTSAVFDDYTYEGDVHTAASKRAWDEGERVQLPRLLALVREARASSRGAATPDAVKRFRAKLSALSYDAPAQSVDSIMKAYAGLKPADREQVESAISVSMHELRRGLLDDMKRFGDASATATPEDDFGEWLKSKQERFEQWLARL
jgi:hypothetical protein